MGFKCEYKCKPAGHLGFHAVYAWIFFSLIFLVIFSDFIRVVWRRDVGSIHGVDVFFFAVPTQC